MERLEEDPVRSFAIEQKDDSTHALALFKFGFIFVIPWIVNRYLVCLQ